MKVYLAKQCESYEPDIILGIFSTKEKAQEKLDARIESEGEYAQYYYFEIEERELQ